MATSRYQQSSQRAEKISQSLASVRGMWVGDVMRRDPICVDVRENIDVAARVMADNNIRHLPVIDSDGNLQGIISDRDLFGMVMRTRPGVLSDRIGNQWVQHKVREFMSKTPETVTPDTELMEAGEIMLEYKISGLPVVEGSRVVGIITEADFVRLVCEGLS